MTGSALGTMLIIAILFWSAYRRWSPLLWLLTWLGITLVGTLALGGLIFGALNVVSFGFAAILLGLAADYVLVIYQESLTTPVLSVAAIRREMVPGIAWGASTTAGAFLTSNFGGRLGLNQLGTPVEIGVTLGAFATIYRFFPCVVKGGALTATARSHSEPTPLFTGAPARGKRTSAQDLVIRTASG